MPSKRLALIAAPLAVAAFAVTPAGASTYCVHQAGASCGAGQIDEGSDLQKALDDAGATPELDTIALSAGTFTGHYVNTQNEALSVVGAGAQKTTLTSPLTTGTILTLGPGTASDLHVDLPALVTGTGIHSSAGTVQRVSVTGGGAGSGTGVNLVNAAKLLDSSVDVGNATVGVRTGAGANLVSDSTVATAATYGIYALQGGVLNSTTVRRSTVSGAPAVLGTNSDITVDESVVVPASGSAGVVGACNAGAVTETKVRVDHVTFRGAGTTAVRSTCTINGHTASVNVTNSLLFGLGAGRDASGGGLSSLNVAGSDLDQAAVTQSGPGFTFFSPDDLNVDPLFVSASDSHLQAGSPVIDKGTGTAPVSDTDRDGKPRIVGLAQDMGAYEVQPVVVTPPPAGGGGGGGAGGGGGNAKPADAPVVTDAPSGQADAPVQQPTGGGPVPVTEPSDEQLRASLRATITAATARSYAYGWLTAGTVRIEWRIGSHVVATGSLTRASGAKASLQLKTTKAGARLLRRHHRVTVRASFTRATGGTRVTTSAVRRTA